MQAALCPRVLALKLDTPFSAMLQASMKSIFRKGAIEEQGWADKTSSVETSCAISVSLP
jgi:hypothetical protein